MVVHGKEASPRNLIRNAQLDHLPTETLTQRIMTMAMKKKSKKKKAANKS